jgi:basic membrane protein A
VRRFLFLFFLSLLSPILAQPYVVGIHFDQGDWSTPGFNQDVWDGVTAATRDLTDSTFDILLFRNRLNSQGQLQDLPSDIDMMIVAGSTQQTFAQAASTALPNTHILLIDAVVDTSNVTSVLFREYEVSYLLGFLAGNLTQTGTVGFIGETRNAKTLANASTFNQGVMAACADCVVLSDYVEEVNNPDKAGQLAATQQSKGVDIFFAPAEGSSQGVIDYVNKTMCFMPNTKRSSPLTAKLTSISTTLAYTAKCQNAIPIFFIGDNMYQPATGDTDNNPETLNHGISAIRKRADRLAYQALADSAQGRTIFGTRVVGLNEDAIEIAINSYNQGLIPEELIVKLEELKNQIISGDIILTLPEPQ